VKNATDHAKVLKTLMSKLRRAVTVTELPQRPPLEQLIHAFLCWETSRNQADRVFPKLLNDMVDINELRVSDPEEMLEAIGADYALAEDRALRIKRVLNAIYRKEYAVDLAHLESMAKRDARAYLDALDGMVPFVSAAIVLLTLGGHAIPVDQQLVDRLKGDGVVDAEADIAEVQAFLEHQIRSDEALDAHLLLRAYVERPVKVDLGAARRTTKKTTKSSRKTSRKATKTTTKKKATTRKPASKSKKTTRKKTTRKTSKARG